MGNKQDICEVDACNNKATVMVRDVLQSINEYGCKESSPMGRRHLFCEDHERDSVTFE